MNTVKNVLLSGLAILSFSMGTALAQEGGDAYPVHQAPKAVHTTDTARVQSGTSDPELPMNWRDLPSYSGQG